MMLGAELTAHLGYEAGAAPPAGQANRRNGGTTKRVKGQDGEMPLTVPRDRDGSFEPELVKKGQTRIDGIDDKIIGLYAHGLTVRDIQAHLEDLYGLKVSPDLISRGEPLSAIGPSDNGERRGAGRGPRMAKPSIGADVSHRHFRRAAGQNPRCGQQDGQEQGRICGPRRDP
jgi:Transposase, Mutator family